MKQKEFDEKEELQEQTNRNLSNLLNPMNKYKRSQLRILEAIQNGR